MDINELFGNVIITIFCLKIYQNNNKKKIIFNICISKRCESIKKILIKKIKIFLNFKTQKHTINHNYVYLKKQKKEAALFAMSQINGESRDNCLTSKIRSERSADVTIM